MTERPLPVNHDQKWTRRCALDAAATFMAGIRDVSPAAIEAVAVEFERHLNRPELPAASQETMKEQHERIQAASHDPHEGREPEVIAQLREQLSSERTYLTRKLSHEEARRGEYYAEIVQLKGDLARALGIAAGSSAQTITEAARQHTENLEKKTNQLAYERNRHQARVEEHDAFRKQVSRALDIDEHVQLATIVEAARQRTAELDKVLGGLDTATALLKKTEDEKHELQEELDRLTVNQLPLQEKIAGYDQFAADVATSLNLEPSAAPNVVMNILRARLSECGDSANPIMRMGDISYEKLITALGGNPGDDLQVAIRRNVQLRESADHNIERLEERAAQVQEEITEVRKVLGAQEEYEDWDTYVEAEPTLTAARRVRAAADGRTSQEEKS